jgi:hypothetical protein
MKRFILSTALTLLISTTLIADGRTSYENRPDVFWQLMELQITESLRTNENGIAKPQLKNIVVFRGLYGDRVDFVDAVRHIKRIHQRSADKETRDLAVAALNAIRSDEARHYLSRHVSRDEIADARVVTRQILIDALNDFVIARR